MIIGEVTRVVVVLQITRGGETINDKKKTGDKKGKGEEEEHSTSYRAVQMGHAAQAGPKHGAIGSV